MKLINADAAMVEDLSSKLLSKEVAHILTEDERVFVSCLLEEATDDLSGLT